MCVLGRKTGVVSTKAVVRHQTPTREITLNELKTEHWKWSVSNYICDVTKTKKMHYVRGQCVFCLGVGVPHTSYKNIHLFHAHMLPGRATTKHPKVLL